MFLVRQEMVAIVTEMLMNVLAMVKINYDSSLSVLQKSNL